MPPLALAKANRAAVKAKAALEARDEAIRAAHESGETVRAIALVVSLSHQRVHQIVRAEQP